MRVYCSFYLGPYAADWQAECGQCKDFLGTYGWRPAMEWAWGHLVMGCE